MFDSGKPLTDWRIQSQPARLMTRSGTAASLFSLAKGFGGLQPTDVLPLTVGFVTSFFAALVVIRLFINYVQSHDFKPFGYYRIVVGCLILLLWVTAPALRSPP